MPIIGTTPQLQQAAPRQNIQTPAPTGGSVLGGVSSQAGIGGIAGQTVHENPTLQNSFHHGEDFGYGWAPPLTSPARGALWYPAAQSQPYRPPQWQPGGQPGGMNAPAQQQIPVGRRPAPTAPVSPVQGGGLWSPQAPQPPVNPVQSILSSNNPQAVQNLMQALSQLGAGSNNAFMQTSAAAQPQMVTPLMGSPAASNGSAGRANYVGNFNTGQNQVSYNQGLGANGGQTTFFEQQNGVDPGRLGRFNPTAANTGGGAGTPAAPSGPQDPTAYNPQNYHPAANPGTGGAAVNLGRGGQASTASPNVVNNSASVGGAAGVINLGRDQQAYSPNLNLVNMSDENVKTEVQSGGRDLAAFLDELGSPKSYEYKDPKHGVGRFWSPMAQELLKSEVGRSAVIETPEGLAVDYGRLIGADLAATAYLNKRINQLEEKLK